MRCDLFLLGYCDISVPSSKGPALLNLCHQKGYVYTPLDVKEEGEDVRIRCRLWTGRALMRAAQEQGVTLCIHKKGGLPLFLSRFQSRGGLLVGGALALLVIWLACSVIWDVRIDVEGEIDEATVRQQLEDSGLSVGRRIATLDTDEVESHLLIHSQGVAWASVNVKGTVAYVQVRPMLKPPMMTETDKEGSGSNLVASCDGRIESVRLMRGDVMVRVGDLVREGQLLISGVRDMGDGSFDTMEAKGEVLAVTEHCLDVEIPLSRQEKVYVGEKKVKKTLFFFGKPIKITKSTGIIEGNCDTIKKMENICLFGAVTLPIAIETVAYLPYEWQTVLVTPERASEEAFAALTDALAEKLQGATLLSKTIRSEITDEKCFVTCTYRCIQNIASPKPFAWDEVP